MSQGRERSKARRWDTCGTEPGDGCAGLLSRGCLPSTRAMDSTGGHGCHRPRAVVGRSKSSHTCLYVLLDSSTAPGGRDEERKGAREGGLGIRSPDRPFKVDDPTDCGRAGQRSARQGTKAMDDDTKQDKEESTPFLHSWRSGGLRGARERLWSVPAEGRNRKRCCFTWGGRGRENRRGSVFFQKCAFLKISGP